MSNGEQGETVTVQDRPGDDADVDSNATDPAGAASPVAADAAGSSVAPAAEDSSAAVDSPADEVTPDAAVASADVAAAGSSSDEPAAEAAAGDDDASAADATTAPASGRSSRGSVRDLEEEGEVAADYLEELLDIVDVDGDIDIDVENGRASLAIVAEEGSDRSLRRLVGPNGEVLEALQELTRLAVQASTGERSRLMLDVAGHRAHRRKVLTDTATKACEEVKTSGKPLSLEPMSAFERKIVHDVVADAGLNSESEGVDPNRHVVILPASA
jgi:spoIIIJ-associated protein